MPTGRETPTQTQTPSLQDLFKTVTPEVILEFLLDFLELNTHSLTHSQLDSETIWTWSDGGPFILAPLYDSIDVIT